ncbi:MAG: hypothetical protein ABSH20_02210 [Tepidisphaeraceae bacterium]|jgi:hypothetical protein
MLQTPEISDKRLSGKRLLLALAILAAALAGWLYWIAASGTPAEYRQSRPGAPAAPVRVAAVDLQWQTTIDPAVQALRAAHPDIVFVQHLTRDSFVELARSLAMLTPEHFLYSELNLDARTPGGCGIISRHQLYRHRELRDGTRDTFAVAAETVVAGRRFLLVSVTIGGPNLAEQSEVLRKSTGLLRTGPLICAGQLGPTPPQGLHTLATDGGAEIYASEHWRTLANGQSGNVAWAETSAAGTK